MEFIECIILQARNVLLKNEMKAFTYYWLYIEFDRKISIFEGTLYGINRVPKLDKWKTLKYLHNMTRICI